jgi:chemotaxis protein MotB
LLNATTEQQRSGLADYFDPKIPISQTSSGGVNVFNGDSVFAQNKLARNGLGGSGKEAAMGEDTNQRNEVSSSEKDVWSKGQKADKMLGNKKEAFIAEKTNDAKSDINADRMTAKDIEDHIKKTLDAAGGKGLSSHLNFKMTDEGLRIDITDNDKSPMFETGSDIPTVKMKKIITIIGNILSLLKNDISITGHTDNSQITGRRNYSNWELSADRANASRRELVNTGFEESRIKRIEGRADKEPSDLQNRRVGIVILHDNSIKAMKKENTKNTEKLNKEKAEKADNLKKNKPLSDIGVRNQIGEASLVPDPLSFQ